jgi:hypothetical protein
MEVIEEIDKRRKRFFVGKNGSNLREGNAKWHGQRFAYQLDWADC